MTYTAKEIANYIDSKINLIPNTNWTIYKGLNSLTHTTGSMQYRDEDFIPVMTFKTMDEVPKNMKDLVNSVQFQIEQNNNKLE